MHGAREKHHQEWTCGGEACKLPCLVPQGNLHPPGGRAEALSQ